MSQEFPRGRDTFAVVSLAASSFAFTAVAILAWRAYGGIHHLLEDTLNSIPRSMYGRWDRVLAVLRFRYGAAACAVIFGVLAAVRRPRWPGVCAAAVGVLVLALMAISLT